ncbi:MAG: carboxypeptidase M32 [Rhodospirillales bacterium]|jgi:carboxypeptidase Taq|nr:carboxypeptidase M32 [Rhodospirillaceae bacterium]MDP6430045.1 carboxypeptidase M32 [Rhodospirillales bacterium]MDP6642720.1 carboxypeptidase M32 [Rhodospirillales bacterium]MDP6841664.1 carboxypeptidase M32 [Rhodospirillales bacterium]
MTPYLELEARFRRLSAIGQAAGMLHWDASVMMPPGGAKARGEQIAVLASVRHEILCQPETGELLDGAEEDAKYKGGLDPWPAANLREMRRIWAHATALPTDLVEARSKASMACEMKWREARPKSDFASVSKLLAEVLRLEREAAAAKAEALDCAPYDALLDQYSPGISAGMVDRVFARLADHLPEFINQVLERQAREPAPVLPEGPFAEATQREVGVRFMKVLGFDFGQGRLDTSLHPFSGGTPDDLRITTRYDQADFATGLMGILHETGHALYEKGLPARWRLQPVGEARGMDIHESQSLIIEMQACRSRPFIDHAAPILAEAFGGAGPAWGADNLYRIYTAVAPGLIRVDADEATYPLHIILRTELERALLSGDLPINDLPAAWNDGMEKLLGLKPNNDADGCMQDIHWFDGAFGYFPSYTMGAIAAAQFYRAAVVSNPDIPAAIGRGDFKPLYAWLGENVHALGAFLQTPELTERATGAPLDPEIFLDHLTARYLS